MRTVWCFIFIVIFCLMIMKSAWKDEIIIEKPDLNIKDCMSSWNIIWLTGDKFVHFTVRLNKNE